MTQRAGWRISGQRVRNLEPHFTNSAQVSQNEPLGGREGGNRERLRNKKFGESHHCPDVPIVLWLLSAYNISMGQKVSKFLRNNGNRSK